MHLKTQPFLKNTQNSNFTNYSQKYYTKKHLKAEKVYSKSQQYSILLQYI